ncbi:hypothetical protein E3Q19_04005 [Wallemia mellicola]|nr:hypothetical protein E3Q19_04005 [Wallemia mellicola]TIC72397.1 hypothetical protein E3Q00_04034 [Wallemia mellicola]
MKPLPKAALFCANLPEQFRDDELKYKLTQLFSKFGKVHHVKLNRDKQNSALSFNFKLHSTQADLALNKSNKLYLKDRLLRVERARVNRSLRISSPSIDSTAIEAFFSRHGEIEFFLAGPSKALVPEESANQGEYVIRFKYRDDCMAAWFNHRQSSLFKLSWAHEVHHDPHNTPPLPLNDTANFPSLTSECSKENEVTLDKNMGALDLAADLSEDVAKSLTLNTRSESFPEMRDHQQPQESPNTPTNMIPSTPQLSPDVNNNANQSMETSYPLTPPTQPLNYDPRPPRKLFRGGHQQSFDDRRGGYRRHSNRPPKSNSGRNPRHYLNMNYMETGPPQTGTYYHGFTHAGQQFNQAYYPAATTPAFIPYPTAINFGQPVYAYPYPMAQTKTNDGLIASNDNEVNVGVGVAAPAVRAGYMTVPPDTHPMAPLRATGFMTTNAGLVPLYSPQDLERWNENLATTNAQQSSKDSPSKDEAPGFPSAGSIPIQQYPMIQQPQPQHLMNVGSVALGLDCVNNNTQRNLSNMPPPRFFGISPPGHLQAYENWECGATQNQPNQGKVHYHDHPQSTQQQNPLVAPNSGFTTGPPGHTPAMRGY